jgi:UDP-N-acetylmuramoyl-tripeptide--D-alanyl-D-alanine ligase
MAELALPGILTAGTLYRRLVIRRTRVVAVAGSYGKSTTVRALSTALCGHIHRYAENNNFLFAAHAILRTRPGTPYAVVEVGIDGPGQMGTHARVLRPDVTVITSIGSEHHRSLGSIESTRREKARLVEALPPSGLAVLNGDDPHVAWMRRCCRGRTITFGFESGNDVRAVDVRLDWPRGTEFTVVVGDNRTPVTTRLLGDGGVRAVLAMLAVAVGEGLAIDPAISSVEQLEPTDGRLQPVALDREIWLLRDDYKSSYETIESALDLLERIPAERKICVLGEVSEPPGSQGPIYRHLGERVAGIASEAVFLGGNFQRYAAGAKRGGMTAERLHDGGRGVLGAVEVLRKILRPGDVVLVKGRDTQRLERITMALQGRTVICDLDFCDARATRCRFCKMLATGWDGRRQVV